MFGAQHMPAWLSWTLAALLAWGVWAVLSRGLGDALTAGQSQALSTLGMLPILTGLAATGRDRWRRASRRGLWLAFLGGVVTCLGNVAYYGAVGRGEKVAAVVTLTALYPLVTILLAVAVLRERLNGVQQAGVGLSLVAIWLFNVQADGGLLSTTVVLALPPIVLWGLSGFLQKLSTNHVPGDMAAIVYLGAFVPVALFLGFSEPWPGSLTARGWLLVLALGFFLAFGNYAVLAAFARGGKASVIAPLGGLYPLVSVPLVVLLFHERIAPRELAGIVTGLASVAALSWESPPVPGPAAPTRTI